MDYKALKFNWIQVPGDSPLDRLTRQKIVGEKMMISRVVLLSGCFVPRHQHENEQFSVVVSGRLQFELGPEGSSQVVEVGAGDVLHLPSGLPHSARALDDTVVLDLFSPPSQHTGVDQFRAASGSNPRT